MDRNFNRLLDILRLVPVQGSISAPELQRRLGAHGHSSTARTIQRDRPLIYAEAQDDASRRALDTFLAPRGYVAADILAGTPVVVFVPVDNDDQRFAALASRLSRAHRDTAHGLEKAFRPPPTVPDDL